MYFIRHNELFHFTNTLDRPGSQKSLFFLEQVADKK
jgi:hypothetical protein